jgi:hypothetical protein
MIVRLHGFPKIKTTLQLCDLPVVPQPKPTENHFEATINLFS